MGLCTIARALNTGLVGGACYKTTSYPLATYQENLLILAEADARLNGFAAGLARLNTYRAYLNSNYVVVANLKYDSYVAADFNPGGIEKGGTALLTLIRALLREILEERYVIFMGQMEGFTDVRRTLSEADIRVPLTPNVGAQLSQRFLYPQLEADRNTATPNPILGIFTPTSVNR